MTLLTYLHFTVVVVCILKPTLKNLQTNYTPSKSSRSSSIELDETTIEIPHMKNEVVSNRKTQTPDRGVAAGGARAPAEIGRSVNPIQTRGADYAPHITASPPNPALTATETGSDVKPDTKVFQTNDADGDFMSRISKGGKRLFIEEFPQASSPGNYLFLQAANAIYI